MSVWTLAGLAALFASFARSRLCASASASWAERLGLAGVLTLATSIIAASVLATLGQLTPVWIALVFGGLAAWIWRVAPPCLPTQKPQAPRLANDTALLLALLLLGIGLRAPLLPAELGGRDQGTYALRAQHTARTGSVDFTAQAIADAATEIGLRPGPGDIFGLSPLVSKHHPRAGLYDGPYRPGLYLADRETGRVTPQFLHGHPSLLAVAELALGSGHGTFILYLQFLLASLVLWSIARRLWPGLLGPGLALGVYVCAPILIWVQRIALTESVAGMLLLAAVLGCLQRRDHPNQPMTAAALCLAAFAWVRGDLWMVLPVLAAILSLRPPHAAQAPAEGTRATQSPAQRPKRALTILALGALASFYVHSQTCYPYLHDEIRRQLGMSQGPTPSQLLAVTALALLLWPLADTLVGRLLAPRPHLRTALIRASRVGSLALAVLGAVLYAWGAQAPSPPYSRLDPVGPLMGPGLVLLALVGVTLAARRWKIRGQAWEVWLLALLAIPCISILFYARRNLPHGTLYYYGRYLVPSLLPLAIFAGVEALLRLRTWLATKNVGKAIPELVTLTAAGACLWPLYGPLLTSPQTRLQEFDGAGKLIDFLTAKLPPEALVVAGGEGWHHTHTFNQVGGALAIGKGREVLPYRTREAAYATLYEQLISQPQATGAPARPVFLLVNEATHVERQEDARIATFDDRLPPPFRAAGIDFVELITHRLTPVSGQLPTAVTRSELRMVLIQVEHDPTAQQEIWAFADQTVRGPPGLQLRGAKWRHGQLCLDPDTALELRLPPGGPGSAVLVANPGFAGVAAHWPIGADGKPWIGRLAKARVRPRDTLGPFVYAERPGVIRIRGNREPIPHRACPHGSLSQLRLLGTDVHTLTDLAGRTNKGVGLHRFTADDDLGHGFGRTIWTRGISLSRFRAGIRPNPDVEASSLVVTSGQPLTFAPEQLPGHELWLRVNLKRSQVAAETRLRVAIDGQTVATFDPPDASGRLWSSEDISLHLQQDVATVTVELVGPGEVLLRDVALVVPPTSEATE